MAKRLTDTDIWDEDWFIDLRIEHKLFFLYIKDKCDHSGMWRPNRRKFQVMVIHNKIIDFDEFLKEVNKADDQGNVKKRIIVMNNGKWFITKFIGFQCGKIFNLAIGAHRGALKLLIFNDIHPKEVPDMEWGGIEDYDLQRLKEIGHGNGLYTLSKELGGSKLRFMERKKEPEQDISGKGGAGGKPIFRLQQIYDTPWEQVDTKVLEYRGLTPEKFQNWKNFVDFIVENKFEEAFKAIFVTPSDFAKIVETHAFTSDKWEPVMKKMLSTGIKPEQNLYFRIPDFIKYVGNKASTGNKSGMDTGTGSVDQGEKW